MVKLDTKTKQIATVYMEGEFDQAKLSTADYSKGVMDILKEYGIVLHWPAERRALKDHRRNWLRAEQQKAGQS